MSTQKASCAVGFASAPEAFATSSILTFVKWCQRRTDPKTAFRMIGNSVGAQVIGVSRWNVERQHLKVATILEPELPSSKLDRSAGMAAVVCGPYIESIKAGSVILLSEVLDNRGVSDPKLEQWLFKRNIKEIAVICIKADARSRDFIELHFSKPPKASWNYLTHTLAPSLAEIYAGRVPGLMMEAHLSGTQNGIGTGSETWSGELLSMANPAQLTRSEWKICALIANGLSKEGISRELTLKPCTIQTHLRNIYAKCGYERFHELALRLVSPEERAHLSSISDAVAA